MTTLSHWQWDSISYLMLITYFVVVSPKRPFGSLNWEECDIVGQGIVLELEGFQSQTTRPLTRLTAGLSAGFSALQKYGRLHTNQCLSLNRTRKISAHQIFLSYTTDLFPFPLNIFLYSPSKETLQCSLLLLLPIIKPLLMI